MGACLALLAGCNTGSRKDQEDESRFSGPHFNEHIRTTDPRTPEEEKAGFKLPPGFDIELYASEPDIGKPINIAFDAKGRLWVTQSHEYPFAAEPGEGKDRISILEDTDGDGRADRFTHFQDTLNIPIGLLPLNDGVIAYSIPSVYKYTDEDGDGKADRQEKLLGPFEHKDTHGMVNNLLRGYDGWVHACHGFTNQSTVAGTDGDSIHMVSGNTFRFRPDGSRVEQTTYGRINPFGLAYDELGYLYSTDCHTSPLYQLIRGGDYTQWGKEEGMGFAPDMKPLEDEATALAGIAYYSDTYFPEEYQKNFYIGDVVACRVYRNSFEFKGSTPVGKKEPDFLLSEDPWFRPVDVKMGPDGALYVADFYNRIIGHYEVPLDHPGRDKARGRIWRITYKGKDREHADRTTASVEELLEALTSDNLPVRMAAADQLADRIGQAAADPVLAMLRDENTDPRTYIHGLWVLYRLNALSDALIKQSAAHPDALVRLHTMRILLEEPGPSFYPLVLETLKDPDPHVQRAALEILVNYPDINTLKTVLALRHRVPEYDTHLLYTARLCLRNLLRETQLMDQVASGQWDRKDALALADVMPGVRTPQAASFLLRYTGSGAIPDAELPRLLQHATRYIPDAQVDELITAAKQRAKNDELELRLFTALRQGLVQRGRGEPALFIAWGSRLAGDLLTGDVPGKQASEARRLAVELAGKYKITSLEPEVEILLQENAEPDLKIAALKALLSIAPERHAGAAEAILQDNSQPVELRQRVARVLGEIPGPYARQILAKVNEAPPGLQRAMVRTLSGSPEGIEIIFQKVREGIIFPRTLTEPEISEHILLNISGAQRKTYDELTTDLPPVSEEKQALLWERLMNFNQFRESSPPSDSLLAAGEAVFAQNCAVCHQVNGKGGLIGPQLTGIGNWGANALAEKILDPNRNVTEAFRTYTIQTKDGKVRTGLFRRDEGNALVFADVSGKEFSIPKQEIAAQKASQYTLMPDQFGDALSQEEFNALLTYLLSLKN